MSSVQTECIAADDPVSIERALKVLQAGGLVAFPTDTVYGLGALVLDSAAVASIYRAKDRPAEKSIPVLLADAADLDEVAVNVPTSARKLAARFWPGPLTLIIPKHPSVPESVSATNTIGVRVPDHPIARALIRAAGPLAVTSANLSGGSDPSTAEEVLQQLDGRIPLIIDGGHCPGGMPSTIVDCTSAELVVLRPGSITLDAMLAAIQPTPPA